MTEQDKNSNTKLKKLKQNLNEYYKCNALANFMLLLSIAIATIVIICGLSNIISFTPLIVPICATVI